MWRDQFAKPLLDHAEVINQMKATCDNIDAQNPAKRTSWRCRINAYQALSEAIHQTAKLHMQLFEVQSPSDDNANNAVSL